MNPYRVERIFHVFHVFYHTDIFADRPMLTQKFTVEAKDAEQAKQITLKKLNDLFGVGHVTVDKVVCVS